jgi:hypothetical protein
VAVSLRSYKSIQLLARRTQFLKTPAVLSLTAGETLE